jgi:hypothetical protein
LLQAFCQQHQLSLSRHGGSMARAEGYYQVFMFAVDAHAELFCKQFDGEQMHASERDKPPRRSERAAAKWKRHPRSRVRYIQ